MQAQKTIICHVKVENQVVTVGLLVDFQKKIDADVADDLPPTACQSRMTQFMDCHALSQCKKAHKAQVNRRDTNIVKDFVDCILLKKEMLGNANDCAVVNADETNFFFSPSFERTVTERGTCAVAVL